MDVGIMFSGGKDSTYAIDFARKKGWNIKWLLSVKPTRTDCFLFHFATVEHTGTVAQELGIPHKLISCDVADPEKEAELVKNAVLEMPKIDSLIFGGTGLQLTQIASAQKALRPHGIEVFAAHAGLEHEDVMLEMLENGYKFMITQIASDGMKKWLGRVISLENYDELMEDALQYGFHPGFEGGYADTFVVEGPHMEKVLTIQEAKHIMEDEYCGHVVFEKFKLSPKKVEEAEQ